ncbi:MAG: OB-fold domain-containing protein [Thaumarchaeota archaeon]|nr:OB-fold domain-containing protein [Nitrososphaerota archaeon]MDG6921730.1 OB-fold domain-containing protein [Nitrososphaerota archaeon]
MEDRLTIDKFYELGRSGNLVGLVCDQGHVTIPPRASCRLCDSLKLKSKYLSGKGKIVSFTQVYVKTKEFPINTPYTLALVRLEEGGNLLGVVDPIPSNLSKDTTVYVKFKDAGEQVKWPRIFFEPI